MRIRDGIIDGGYLDHLRHRFASDIVHQRRLEHCRMFVANIIASATSCDFDIFKLKLSLPLGGSL